MDPMQSLPKTSNHLKLAYDTYYVNAMYKVTPIGCLGDKNKEETTFLMHRQFPSKYIFKKPLFTYFLKGRVYREERQNLPFTGSFCKWLQ